MELEFNQVSVYSVAKWDIWPRIEAVDPQDSGSRGHRGGCTRIGSAEGGNEADQQKDSDEGVQATSRSGCLVTLAAPGTAEENRNAEPCDVVHVQ